MEKFINMNNGILLILIIFLHVLADFNMQGIMAQMKSKDYWKKYDKKYQFDYVMPLIGHSFQWSFIVNLPITITAIYTGADCLEMFVCMSIIFHTILHAYIDTLKANDNKTTLIQDQFYHMLQLILLWVVYCIIKENL